jgi:hypothetical protein
MSKIRSDAVPVSGDCCVSVSCEQYVSLFSEETSNGHPTTVEWDVGSAPFRLVWLQSNTIFSGMGNRVSSYILKASRSLLYGFCSEKPTSTNRDLVGRTSGQRLQLPRKTPREDEISSSHRVKVSTQPYRNAM